MVISFEGNKLEYGKDDVLSEYIKFEPFQYHFIDEDSREIYRKDDIIIEAHFDKDEDIWAYMKSGDMFLLLNPFDEDKIRVKKIKIG